MIHYRSIRKGETDGEEAAESMRESGTGVNWSMVRGEELETKSHNMAETMQCEESQRGILHDVNFNVHFHRSQGCRNRM